MASPSVTGLLSAEYTVRGMSTTQRGEDCSTAERDTLLLSPSEWLPLGSPDQEGPRVKGPRSYPANSLRSAWGLPGGRLHGRWGWWPEGWGGVLCQATKSHQAINEKQKESLVSCPQFLTWK